MEYVWLEETIFEEIYRNSAWGAFQYLLCNEEILKDEKYKSVYNDLLNFFVERRKVQLNLDYFPSAQVINSAKREYYAFVHNRNFTQKRLDDFIENYSQFKNLLVIRPKK